MDIDGVAPLHPLDAALAAWALAIAAEPVSAVPVDGGARLLTHEGLAERMLGEAPADVGEPAAAPGAQTDLGSKTAAIQAFAKPQAPVSNAAVHNDTSLPFATHALSEFAQLSAQLVPAALIGLQVEAAWTRTLPQPTPDARRQAQTAHEPPTGDALARDQDDAPDAEVDAEASAPDAPNAALEAAAGDACDTLVRTLQSALAGAVRPGALAVAAEQWQRGRCVVLACPQGADPAGAAFAFVLWPRRAVRREANGGAAPLALVAHRVDARLLWRQQPIGARWCHARLMKEHHPRHGRQLVAIEGADAGAAVQLGPVVTPHPRPHEVCVRIDAVRRFWLALGAQWSIHVVVCSLPLAGCKRRVEMDMPC